METRRSTNVRTQNYGTSGSINRVRVIYYARRLAAAAALTLAALLPSHSAKALGCSYADPTPTGTLQMARPAVEWKVWPSGGSHVTRSSMVINGTGVPASYSSAHRMVAWAPQKPLLPGRYNVRASVVIDGWWPVKKEWTFSVSGSARNTFSGPDEGQRVALETANYYRRLMGLPEFRLHNSLCAAAKAHSVYLARNGSDGHFEEAGTPGYVGVNPWDRAAVYGYSDFGYEDVSSGDAGPVDAVTALVAAPYHRAAFMQPGTPDFGAGVAGDRATLDFGRTEDEGVVAYPVNGERNVPCSWTDNEVPSPLRCHGAQGTVGYVITLFNFSSEDGRVGGVQASLSTASGQPVPFYLNTPANDNELTNGILMIPHRPLAPHTTYMVSVRAATGHGRDISRRWSFTTGG